MKNIRLKKQHLSYKVGKEGFKILYRGRYMGGVGFVDGKPNKWTKIYRENKKKAEIEIRALIAGRRDVSIY